MITREDYDEANQYGKEQLFLKLLKERDAYREVASSWNDKSLRTLEYVDAEARRLMEKKGGK